MFQKIMFLREYIKIVKEHYDLLCCRKRVDSDMWRDVEKEAIPQRMNTRDEIKSSRNLACVGLQFSVFVSVFVSIFAQRASRAAHPQS